MTAAQTPPLALVTGATSGIGRELARHLAADGYDLVLVARRSDALERVAGELGARVTVRTVIADLSEPAGIEAVRADLAGHGTDVDVLINCAGFATYGEFVATSADDEMRMLGVNVVALTALAKAVLPGMVARRRGRVMNVASTAAFLPGGPLMSVYYATKAYVLSLSVGLAEEVASSGVTVTALCPGPTATGFTDRADMGESKLMAGGLMSAADVAAHGYRQMMSGKRIVTPGAKNKAIALVPRVVSRAAAARMAKNAQERTGH